MGAPISSKLTAKCQATIPEKIRGILDLHPGDSVDFEVMPDKKAVAKALQRRVCTCLNYLG